MGKKCIHFVEEHCFDCASALFDCVDEYGTRRVCVCVREREIILLLIKHSLLGLRDITGLDGKDLRLTS